MRSGPGTVPAVLEVASDAFAVLREIKDYAIYVIDPVGRVLTWNDGARAIKGYRAEEIIGQNFSRFFTEQDRDEGLPISLLSRAEAEGAPRTRGGACVRMDHSFGQTPS